jgi:hypothetical protein
MTYQVQRPETAVVENLLGRVKGIEIRFHDRRTPLRILRADPAMTNAKELIEAVVYRMAQIRELETEIAEVNGKTLVRNIHWKGVLPEKPTGKALKAVLVSLIAFALLFGAILGLLWVQTQSLLELASVPAHAMTLDALIQDGPGTNRHIAVQNFEAGGYVFESESSGGSTRWTNVWIALFPAGADADEIKVVVSSKAVRSEADLIALFQQPQIKGICSEAPRTSWGLTLGPELEKANDGLTLRSAWHIEELREPPRAEVVAALLTGAITCFVTVLLCSAIVFWKG